MPGAVSELGGVGVFWLIPPAAVPRTVADGPEAEHENIASQHRKMDSRQVLHRFGNVATRLATSIYVFIESMILIPCLLLKMLFH